jgi:hypothetical protein
MLGDNEEKSVCEAFGDKIRPRIMPYDYVRSIVVGASG